MWRLSSQGECATAEGTLQGKFQGRLQECEDFSLLNWETNLPSFKHMRTSVASFFLPTAMMHRPTVNVENASHVSAVPMATLAPAPEVAMDVAMALQY